MASTDTKRKVYKKSNIHTREETMEYEFKGHRSFSREELPGVSILGHSNRPTRQPVSKYACGMINTRKGGVILLGVLDDGRIEGFMLTKFQQDHVRLSIQDTFERYNPQLPPHLYSVYFVPVVEDDKDSSSELEAIDKYMSENDPQDKTLPHLLQTNEYCWCDAASNAMMSRGLISPFYVVELHVHSWDPDDTRNEDLIEDHFTDGNPLFKAEDGVAYVRRFGSNNPVSEKIPNEPPLKKD